MSVATNSPTSRKTPSRSSARSRSRPSRSTSTPLPIRASAPRSTENVLPQPAAVRTEEMVNYFPYDYATPQSTAQPFSTNVAVFPSPWSPGRKLVRIGIKGYSVQRGDAAARQPRLPDRHVGIDERAQQAAAGQAVARHAARRARRARHGRDRHLCGQRRHRARADPGEPEGADPGGDRPARRGRQHRRRRGHPPGLCAGRGAIYDPKGVNRVILATDGDFNVGITNQDELKGYRRARARQGRVPVGARLRHGQLQRRADADAGPERQRRRRLYRHRRARRGRRWSRRRPRPCSRSPRT